MKPQTYFSKLILTNSYIFGIMIFSLIPLTVAAGFIAMSVVTHRDFWLVPFFVVSELVILVVLTLIVHKKRQPIGQTDIKSERGFGTVTRGYNTLKVVEKQTEHLVQFKGFLFESEATYLVMVLEQLVTTKVWVGSSYTYAKNVDPYAKLERHLKDLLEPVQQEEDEREAAEAATERGKALLEASVDEASSKGVPA